MKHLLLASLLLSKIDNNGWIGGNRTLEGAIQMAKKTLMLYKLSNENKDV
jgi:hypothetical protein